MKFKDLGNTEQGSAMLTISDSLARGRHEDYDEVVSMVMEQAQKDPELRDKIMSSADPAETSYNLGVEDARVKEEQEMYADQELIEANKVLKKADADLNENRRKTRKAEWGLIAINEARKEAQALYEDALTRSGLGELSAEAVENAYQALLSARKQVDRASDTLKGLKGAFEILRQRQESANSHLSWVYRNLRNTAFEEKRQAMRDTLLPLLEDYGVLCTIRREWFFTFDDEMMDCAMADKPFINQ